MELCPGPSREGSRLAGPPIDAQLRIAEASALVGGWGSPTSRVARECLPQRTARGFVIALQPVDCFLRSQCAGSPVQPILQGSMIASICG